MSQELLKTYSDNECMLKDEIDNMRGSDQMFKSFYETLNSTREYHEKYPSSNISAQPSLQAESIAVDVQFSGEEVFGKYLDLNTHYMIFSNLSKKYSIDQDYLQYLERFNNFFYLPEALKCSKGYLEYLEGLHVYLQQFFDKVHPLVDLSETIKEWQSTFVERCLKNEISGYKMHRSGDNKAGQESGGESKKALRLGMFSDVEELEALGLERLKEALEAVGVKCGGSLQERAQRLWSIRGKKPAEFPSNILAKKRKQPPTEEYNGDKDGSSSSSSINSNTESIVEYSKDTTRNKVARREYDIQCFCELMSEIVAATKKHAEKQQTRTTEEKEAEIREEEFGLLPDVVNRQGGGEDGEDAAALDEDDEEDDEPVYNPLNIPLGWDGKPIPYWLYKLHGLGNEYKCEICGNQSYMGRKAFDRHFQETKHALGMRALGIPNTKHFHDITLIEDALALHAKLSGSIAAVKFTGEVEEEFEDSEGNILNRRTYEDLARQGLL